MYRKRVRGIQAKCKILQHLVYIGIRIYARKQNEMNLQNGRRMWPQRTHRALKFSTKQDEHNIYLLRSPSYCQFPWYYRITSGK